jgi:hypothetical protein
MVVVASIIYSFVHLWKFIEKYGDASGDFLGVFPAPTPAKWTGRLDDLYFIDSGSYSHYLSDLVSWGHGPIFHFVTLPLFAFNDVPTAYDFLIWPTLGFYIASWLALLRFGLSDDCKWYLFPAITLISLNFSPAYEALAQRNPEILELLLVSTALLLFSQQRERVSGALVGIAAGIKFLPGILVLQFLVTRRRNAIQGSLVTLALIAVVTQIALGWQNSTTLKYFFSGKDPDFGTTWYEHSLNSAVSGVVLRALSPGDPKQNIALLVTLVIALALCVWLWRTRQSSDWTLHWGILMIASVMLLPHNQPYYLCLLIPSYVIALRRLSIGAPKWQWVLFWASYLTVGWGIPMSMAQRLPGLGFLSIHWLYEHQVAFYGVMALTVVLLVSPVPVEEGEIQGVTGID